MISATQLRVGAVIRHQGELYRVMSIQHVKPGKGGAYQQTKLRNLRTGLQMENRFRSSDSVDRVVLDQQEMEFLYEDPSGYHFMNTETFEQIALTRDDLGDGVGFLTPNLRVTVEFFEGTPLGVSLPKTVDLKVTDTPPGIKTATVTNVLKPATTETGVVVQVPNFIENGDVIRVGTEKGEYLSRAK